MVHEERAILRKFGVIAPRRTRYSAGRLRLSLKMCWLLLGNGSRNFALMASCKVLVVLENNMNWLLFSSERLKKLIFGKLIVGKTVSFLFFIYLCRKNYWFNET